jgi:hypothetical protein
MRTFVVAAVLVLGMVVGARVSAAQVVDPSTGMMVDAATDPMDFSAIMSGQPTNVGLEAGLSAAAQMNAEMNATLAASQAATDSLNASNASDAVGAGGAGAADDAEAGDDAGRWELQEWREGCSA